METSMPRYHVTLTAEERKRLEGFRKGKNSARSSLVATALLMMDEGGEARKTWSVDETSLALGVSDRALSNWKKRFVEEGLEAALGRKESDTVGRPAIFDGEAEAKLIALATSSAPEGHARWTVRLLADKAVELGIVPSISHMTVHRILKKTNLSLTSQGTGKSPRDRTPPM